MSIERAGWTAEHPVRDGKVEVVTSEWAWEIKAERDAARAEVSGLRKLLADAGAEAARLRKAVEHYADDANWINGQEYKTFPGFHGAAVARSALDGGER